MASTYKYQDLGSATVSLNICILVLQPGSLDDDLHCDLLITPLEQAQLNFEALSYTWGPPSEARYIHIGNATKAIGDNLFQALGNLRTKSAPRRLWADALCINQDDEVEKTQQVASMGEIYQAAIRTVIWLGEESPLREFDFATRFFEWVVPIFGTRYPNARDPRGTYLKPPSKDSYVDVDEVIEAFNDECSTIAIDTLTLPTIQAFYDRSWFGRRWILQEVHNGREMIIYCGRQTMPWKLFQDAMGLPLNVRVGHWKPQTIASLHGRLDVSLVDVLQTLETYHAFECADDRDLLSTLLNFRAYRLLTNHYRLFKVDYTKSVEQNFIAFAKELVDQGRVLSLLVHATKRRRKDQIVQTATPQTLPSWVPDWRTSPIAPAHALDFYGYPAEVDHDNFLTIEGRITHRITSKITYHDWNHHPQPQEAAQQMASDFPKELAINAPKPQAGDKVLEFTMYDGSRGPSFVLRDVPGESFCLLICECMPYHLMSTDRFEAESQSHVMLDVRLR